MIVTEETHYPFDENVRLKISLNDDVRFPLYLRVPGWCCAPEVKVNGQPVPIADSAKGGNNGTAHGFIAIDRTWRNGDVVELTLPMQLAIRRWAKNGDSVSVDRGPLTFSLKIQEDYRRLPGIDKWPSWEIKPASPWNYGLVMDQGDVTRSFEVVKRTWPADQMPFTHQGTPILLKAKGRRIPQWQLDAHGLIEELQPSPALTSAPVEEITLVPMGAARLRISAFPVADDGPGAHAWTKPVSPTAKN